eukprot:6488982-Amphidinium_carterae.1
MFGNKTTSIVNVMVVQPYLRAIWGWHARSGLTKAFALPSSLRSCSQHPSMSLTAPKCVGRIRRRFGNAANRSSKNSAGHPGKLQSPQWACNARRPCSEFGKVRPCSECDKMHRDARTWYVCLGHMG